MRLCRSVPFVLAVLASVGLGAKAPAAETRAASTADEVLAASAAEQKFTYLLLWKEENAAKREMATTLKTALAKKSRQATWTSVKVSDPANRALVERLRVSRAPTPMVLCVAPNGAVTAALAKRPTAQAIQEAIVTPAMTECMKALQEGKTVVVHVKKDRKAALPAGAAAFIERADFEGRTAAVGLLASDPAEGRFIKDMEIDPAAVKTSLVVVLAPPGVLVGKFPPNVSAEQMAAELHAAGKCCEDPNCKHHRKEK